MFIGVSPSQFESYFLNNNTNAYGLNSEKREYLLKTASGSDKVTIKNIAKVTSTPRQTSEMDPFPRTFSRLELLTILAYMYQIRCLTGSWIHLQ